MSEGEREADGDYYLPSKRLLEGRETGLWARAGDLQDCADRVYALGCGHGGAMSSGGSPSTATREHIRT